MPLCGKIGVPGCLFNGFIPFLDNRKSNYLTRQFQFLLRKNILLEPFVPPTLLFLRRSRGLGRFRRSLFGRIAGAFGTALAAA